MPILANGSQAVLITACSPLPKEYQERVETFRGYLADRGVTSSVEINHDPLRASFRPTPDDAEQGFAELSAPVSQRASVLVGALRKPGVDLVVNLCGGEGGFAAAVLARKMMLAGEVPFDRLPALLGWSDFNGCMNVFRSAALTIEGFGATANPDAFRDLFADFFMGEKVNHRQIPLRDAANVSAGEVIEGVIYGGSLPTFLKTLGVLDRSKLEGKILFAEAVRFNTKTVDAIKDLKPAAVVFGSFLFDLTPQAVADLGVPTFFGYPFGHAFPDPNESRYVPHGARVIIKESDGIWVIDASSEQGVPRENFSPAELERTSPEVTLKCALNKPSLPERWNQARELVDFDAPMVAAMDTSALRRLNLEFDGATPEELRHLVHFVRAEVLPLFPDHVEIHVNDVLACPAGEVRGRLEQEALAELRV